MRVLSAVALVLLGLAPAAWANDDIALAPSGRSSVPADDRAAIADYYRSEHRAGHCPTGLIRTELGCERKPLWTLGAPLDSSVAVESLPAMLRTQLSPAPDGTRYIRVGDRILLMETGSRVILGELLDLGQIGEGRVTPRLRLSGGSGASR